ncbi:uncharacterized protein LOC115672495 [Syzygium oleosum]|uniref:uncharacterized protein LOC115672495 n=1 Tax=Syzygium oleosum TaxID=219896 RepID=UPI0024B99710|nr:uncharacterized protein LOC115672495 [Syzygium oleosum]
MNEARKANQTAMAHPDCRNTSNPYHECSAYCFRIIAEAKARDQRDSEVEEASKEGSHSKLPYHEVAASRNLIDYAEEPADDDNKPPVQENVEGDITKLTGRKKKLLELRPKMNEGRRANQTTMAHPDCRNTSNPYHECSAYCFRIIAEAKARDRRDSEVADANAEGSHSKLPYHEVAASRDEIYDAEELANDDNKPPVEENVEGDIAKLTGRKKKLFDLSPKMNEARKANQTAVAYLDCRNVSNPYHECSAYCFRIIAEAKAHDKRGSEVTEASAEGSHSKLSYHEVAASRDEIDAEDDNKPPVEENVEGDITKLTGRKRKLFELRSKMNEARKANQTAMTHPDCRNASNPYHECSAYCFRIITEAKARDRRDSEVSEASAESSHCKLPYHEVGASRDEIDDAEEPADDDNKPPVQETVEGHITKLTGRKKKLFELRPKMVCNLT